MCNPVASLGARVRDRVNQNDRAIVQEKAKPVHVRRRLMPAQSRPAGAFRQSAPEMSEE